MADRVADLVVRLKADTAQLDRELNRTSTRVDKFAKGSASSFGVVGRAVAGLATAFAGLAGLGALGGALRSAEKQARAFELTLSRIVGLVGESRENVARFADELLRIGPSTGQDINALANALFFVTSAGARGTEALEILQQAAKAATAGLGDAAVVADAVTSAVNTYGKANLDAASATGILVAAIREGKTSADQLAPSIGRVLPIAEALGVRFDEVAATVAALTRGGLSASESITALTGALKPLIKPTAEAEKALASVGLTVDRLRQSITDDGLLVTLQLLRESFRGNEEGLSDLFSEMNGLVAVLSLTGKSAKDVEGIFARLATETGGSLKDAFFAAAETADFEFNAALRRIDASAIKLGNTLKGPLASAIDIVAKSLEGLAELFSGLPALDLARSQQELARVGTEIIGVRRELAELAQQTTLPGAGEQERAIALQQRLIDLRQQELSLLAKIGKPTPTPDLKIELDDPDSGGAGAAASGSAKADKATTERISKRETAERNLNATLRTLTEERLQLAGREADLIGLRATAELAQLDELSRIIPEQESKIQDARVTVVRNALEEIAKLEDEAAEERAKAAADLAKEQREEFVRSFDGVRQVISQTIGGLLLQQERDWDAFFRSLVASFVSTGVDKILEQLVNGLAGSSAASGASGGGGGFVGSLLGIVGGLLFAKGGVVSRPTLGVVGEAGPEAVIPLDRLDRMLASQQSGVTVNIIGAPEGTEVKRSKSADGTEQIDAFIGGSMARNMQRGFQRQRFAPGVIGG